jgi:hypothetical protein
MFEGNCCNNQSFEMPARLKEAMALNFELDSIAEKFGELRWNELTSRMPIKPTCLN